MQIAVVGCGWLGLPLAVSLQRSGYDIAATCRSEQKARALTKLGFNAQKYELGEELTHICFEQLFKSNVLVLNIPVGRKNPTPENFVKHMQTLLEHAASKQIQNLIFISTTSVYGDSNGVITEQSPTPAQTQSGQINLAIEVLVKRYFAGRNTIIRPAGLVGKDRHPAHYIAGKTGLLNPDNRVNLVHQDDVICAIQTVIKEGIWGQTLHLSALGHPTRAEYYTWAAHKLNLSEPEFVRSEGTAAGKQIDATESLRILGLSLKFPSPFDMLKQ
jgi:nucleoside-diphosphate-sugar epimerase